MTYHYTATGLMHQNTKTENQDFFDFRETERYLLAAVADGATACPHSAQGARLACGEALAYTQAHMDALWHFSGQKTGFLLLEQIRAKLTQHANALGHRPEDYASTLSMCCYDKLQRKMLLFQLGDSPIVFTGQGQDTPLLLTSRETNGNCPLTMTNAAFKAARILHLENVDAGSILLCTDGVPRACSLQAILTADPALLESRLNNAEKQDDCSFITFSIENNRK